jgi:hypothetical protein
MFDGTKRPPRVARNLLLHLHGTPHGPVDTVEGDEQGVATRLNDPAAVLLNRGIDHLSAECPQPFKRPNIVQPNQPAVPGHIHVDYGDQLPPV